MIIKRLCHFLLDREKDKPDAKLRYHIKWDGKQLAFSVGYRVNIDRWNTETQRCVANSSHGKKRVQASVINSAIQQMEMYVTEVFTHFEAKGHSPTVSEFRDEYNRRTARTDSKSKSEMLVLEVLDLFIKSQSRENLWSRETHLKFATMRTQLTQFNRKLRFEDLDSNGLSAYVSYLREDLDHRDSTVMKKVGFIKWFLNWATLEGYNTNMAFKSFSPKTKSAQKEIIFLDWDELIHLYEFDFSSRPALAQVRDVFCFCCFTSLRYSDVANLKRANIRRDHIAITTVKTNDTLKIELNKRSREILERYSGIEYSNDLALPVISNQKMNEQLKEVCKIAGLDNPIELTYYKGGKRYSETHLKYELISTHAGRRTFICNALMMGISPEIVMKWTGHSDYDSMKPYIAVADRAKAAAMTLFDR